ncbi:MAG: hypothetical protein ACRYFS_23510 [Janthinobacterium lividum]
MQTRFAVLIIFAGMLGMVPTSLADPGTLAPRAAIQANYDCIYSAARHKDLSRAVRYFSADFRGEDRINTPANKTPMMDLAQFRQLAADYSQSAQFITGHAVIQRLVLNGNEATATIVHHVIVLGTPDPRTGKCLHCVFDATTQDTWKQEPEGWTMQQGRGISLKVQRHDS